MPDKSPKDTMLHILNLKYVFDTGNMLDIYHFKYLVIEDVSQFRMTTAHAFGVQGYHIDLNNKSLDKK